MNTPRAPGGSRQNRKRRKIVVPFDQRRYRAEAANGVRVERPHAVTDRMIMRVEQVIAVIAVTREMKLRDPLGWYRVDIFPRAEAMVKCVYKYIVDIEQNTAVSFLGDRAHEFPLGHRRSAKRQVTRYVLD